MAFARSPVWRIGAVPVIFSDRLLRRAVTSERAGSDGAVQKDSAGKIATQHRLIGSLFEGLGAALSDRDAERAHDRAASLERALDAHFRLEEAHYFPRLLRERPDREPDLARLAEEHATLRSRAESVAAHLGSAAWSDAARAFDALHSLFQRHEASERKVVESGSGRGPDPDA